MGGVRSCTKEAVLLPCSPVLNSVVKLIGICGGRDQVLQQLLMEIHNLWRIVLLHTQERQSKHLGPVLLGFEADRLPVQHVDLETTLSQ